MIFPDMTSARVRGCHGFVDSTREQHRRLAGSQRKRECLVHRANTPVPDRNTREHRGARHRSEGVDNGTN